MISLEGRCHVVGDNINTDYIISSRRKRDTVEPQILKEYFMEDLIPTLRANIQNGDILVAGQNFGCGSAMEVAVTVIQALGIRAVIAKSFARSFYRNGINNGLPVIEADTSKILDGDVVHVDLTSSQTRLNIPARNITLEAKPFSPLLLDILRGGGIVAYLNRKGHF